MERHLPIDSRDALLAFLDEAIPASERSRAALIAIPGPTERIDDVGHVVELLDAQIETYRDVRRVAANSNPAGLEFHAEKMGATAMRIIAALQDLGFGGACTEVTVGG